MSPSKNLATDQSGFTLIAVLALISLLAAVIAIASMQSVYDQKAMVRRRTDLSLNMLSAQIARYGSMAAALRASAPYNPNRNACITGGGNCPFETPQEFQLMDPIVNGRPTRDRRHFGQSRSL